MPAVLVEVLGVAVGRGLADPVEEPAHVRVPEPGDGALEAAAVPVRGVRVALPVGVRVVLAVVGDPGHHGPLHRHRAERGQRVLDRLERLERAVRQQPVEAQRHAVAREHVHQREHREVAPVDVRVPEQHDRGHEREEREQHRNEVGDLVCPGHRLSDTPESSRLLARWSGSSGGSL